MKCIECSFTFDTSKFAKQIFRALKLRGHVHIDIRQGWSILHYV